MVKKTLLMAAGSTIFIIGMVLFPLPVPFGLPTMIVGLSLMFKASDKVKRSTLKLFNKYPYSRNAWQKVRVYRLGKKARNSRL